MKQLNRIDTNETATCKTLFYNYDMNGYGYIDTEDLLKYYAKNDLSGNSDDALNTIKRFDTNKDNKLSYIEFINFFKNKWMCFIW